MAESVLAIIHVVARMDWAAIIAKLVDDPDQLARNPVDTEFVYRITRADVTKDGLEDIAIKVNEFRKI